MAFMRHRWTKVATSALLSLLAGAAASQVLPESIQGCRKEPDDARRLACFDRETARFPMTREESFGLSPAQIAARPPALEQISARVVTLRERPRAGFVATLDNGQVWIQSEVEANRGIHAGDTVKLRPAMLGSIWMVGPRGWATKVRRAK